MAEGKHIDPRGIKRCQTAVDASGCGPVLVTMECGHISERANHFHYRVGDECFCYECGVEARAAIAKATGAA